MLATTAAWVHDMSGICAHVTLLRFLLLRRYCSVILVMSVNVRRGCMNSRGSVPCSTDMLLLSPVSYLIAVREGRAYVVTKLIIMRVFHTS